MLENVRDGVIANFVFLFLIALISLIIWAFFYGKKMLDATRFFGVGLDDEIYVYVSTHTDQQTRTRRVVTAEEFESVIESQSILASQFHSNRFYEATIALSQLLKIAVRIPDLIVKASPLDVINTPQIGKSLILVGGPTRNQISKYYLENGNSWLTFDDEKKKFLINRGKRKGEELNPSGQMAIISKIIVENSVAFIIFGFGEIETRSALAYFVHNWRDLYNEFGKNEFGICFVVGEYEESQIHLKLSDN